MIAPRWRVRINRRPAARSFIVLRGTDPRCLHESFAEAIGCAQVQAFGDPDRAECAARGCAGCPDCQGIKGWEA